MLTYQSQHTLLVSDPESRVVQLLVGRQEVHVGGRVLETQRQKCVAFYSLMPRWSSKRLSMIYLFGLLCFLSSGRRQEETLDSNQYVVFVPADLRRHLEHQEDLQALHVNAAIQQLHGLVQVVLSGQRNHQLQQEATTTFL